jgi:hypothetical protein
LECGCIVIGVSIVAPVIVIVIIIVVTESAIYFVSTGTSKRLMKRRTIMNQWRADHSGPIVISLRRESSKEILRETSLPSNLR